MFQYCEQNIVFCTSRADLEWAKHDGSLSNFDFSKHYKFIELRSRFFYVDLDT